MGMSEEEKAYKNYLKNLKDPALIFETIETFRLLQSDGINKEMRREFGKKFDISFLETLNRMKKIPRKKQ